MISSRYAKYTAMQTPQKNTNTARLFLGIPIPAPAEQAITAAIRKYPPTIERVIPSANWHITLVFLGEVKQHEQYMDALLQPLPQAFLPTATVTHVGQGKKPSQLWAYIHVTHALHEVRNILLQRLEEAKFPLPDQSKNPQFTPHITVARLAEVNRFGVPDQPVHTTFVPQEICLYRSFLKKEGAKYTVEGTLSLEARNPSRILAR